MATGVLAVALGEATKTVAFAMDGEKTYLFTACWGEARSTDDAEGVVTATSPTALQGGDRTGAAGLRRGHPQTPPAIRRSKSRASGPTTWRATGRPSPGTKNSVHQIRQALVTPDSDHAEFEIHCGKGTYVRAWVRDWRAPWALAAMFRPCAAPGLGLLRRRRNWAGNAEGFYA